MFFLGFAMNSFGGICFILLGYLLQACLNERNISRTCIQTEVVTESPSFSALQAVVELSEHEVGRV